MRSWKSSPRARTTTRRRKCPERHLHPAAISRPVGAALLRVDRDLEGHLLPPGRPEGASAWSVARADTTTADAQRQRTLPDRRPARLADPPGPGDPQVWARELSDVS